MNALTLIRATVEPGALLSVPAILKAVTRAAHQGGWTTKTFGDDLQIEHAIGDYFLVLKLDMLGDSSVAPNIAFTVEIQDENGDNSVLWYDYHWFTVGSKHGSAVHDFLGSASFPGFLRGLLQMAQHDKPAFTQEDAGDLELVNGDRLTRYCKEHLPK